MPRRNVLRADSEQDRFKKALASVLSVPREEMQKRVRKAKAEKPSPHKKYSFDPEADRS